MTTAVAIALLGVQTFPAGTTVGPVLFELVGADGSVVASQSAASGAADDHGTASFADVAPGTYSVRATRQDGSGNALGTPVASDPFTITAPTTVNVSVPTSVSVALS